MLYSEGGTLTLRDWVAKFQFVTGVKHTTNTHRGYGIRMDRFVAYLDTREIEMVEDINRRHVNDFVIELRKTLSPASVNAHLAALGSFFRYLVNDCEVRMANPMQGIKYLRLHTKAATVLSNEEIAALEKVAVTLEERIIARLPRLSGLRVDELFHLEMKHVSFDRKMLVLPPAITKGDKGRSVPLRDDVLELLKEARDSGVTGRIFSKTKSLATMHSRLNQLKAKAGITREFNFHELRRTYGTGLMRAGLDVKSVSVLLGHENISTTSQYLACVGSDEVTSKLNALP